MFFTRTKTQMPDAATALRGNAEPVRISGIHYVNGNTIVPPFPEGLQTAYFGMGCFWGAERLFWQTPGVYSTSVGYAGGFTENATYEQVCSGKTGHAEVVMVVYDPAEVSYEQLLQVFWENHDPTQWMRQGNDVGTQYRSAIFWTDEAQRRTAEAVKARVQASGKWKRPIVTEIAKAGPWWRAEEYHQDYLVRNPGGYTCHYMREW